MIKVLALQNLAAVLIFCFCFYQNVISNVKIDILVMD